MKIKLKNQEGVDGTAGLYSQGLRAGDWIYTTQIGNVPGGALVGEGVYEQTIQALQNAEALLSANGAALSDVVTCTIYITDMDDYAELNRAYGEMMPRPYPVRACVQVARLSPGSKVEMTLAAYVGP